MLACGVVAGSAVLVLLALLGRPLRALLDATLNPWTPQKAGVLLLAGSVLAMALLWRHGKGRWGATVGVTASMHQGYQEALAQMPTI